MLQIIIPIKPLHKAKSRLVSVLESHTRESLVLMMLNQVIKASKDALGSGSCTVLGGDKIIEPEVVKGGEQVKADLEESLVDEENAETPVEKDPEVEIATEEENIEVTGDSPVVENQTNGGGENQVLEDSVNELESERKIDGPVIESEVVGREQEIEVNENSEIEQAADDNSASEISDQTN